MPIDQALAMATRNLLSGPITLSTAIAQSNNVLHALEHPPKRQEFYGRMESQRHLMGALVAHHLGIVTTDVTISPQDYWRHGSFNLCIPIQVKVSDNNPSTPKFVMLRFPLPYRVGEATNPGNSDEKLRCEAATYAWLQENCPSVPIPQLYGFGLSTNQRFTKLSNLPWWLRWFHQARRHALALFGSPYPSQYVCHNSNLFASLGVGYLLIETVTRGEMLSETWEEKQDDVRLLDNLQRDLARIILSLTKIPLPRIGAFRVDNYGYLHLDNRSLNIQFAMQENEGIPLDIPRRTTFSAVDKFVLEHLAAFDNRLIHQPNAITSHSDGWFQMASLAAARAVFPHMFRKDLCNGPFVFTLTDLHRSNIFVDKDWHITCIIDLEFACSWPLEFQQPPYWLGGELIDEIDPTGFGPRHARFVAIVEEQEQLSDYRGQQESLSSIMRQAWTSGAFWVTLAIKDPVAFTSILYDRILPDHLSYSTKEVTNTDYKFLSCLWRPDIPDIIENKLQDHEKYLEKIDAAFRLADDKSPCV